MKKTPRVDFVSLQHPLPFLIEQLHFTEALDLSHLMLLKKNIEMQHILLYFSFTFYLCLGII